MRAGVATGYADYLQLPHLLAAVDPLTSRANRQQWNAERYFLICHQVSELWVSQVLADLELVDHLIDTSGPRDTIAVVVRARLLLSAATAVLSDHLRALTVDEFRSFRPLLAGSSGAESPQFARLLAGPPPPILAGINAKAAGLPAPGHGPDYRLELLAELDATAAQIGVWRLEHLKLVRHFIGDSRRGTGGTAGVNYLIDQLTAAAKATDSVGSAATHHDDR